jgi:hypothetical protein
MTCDAPLSWLILERHALGELEGDERARVVGHLTGCAECRGCLSRIEADATRPLASLPAKAPARRVVRFPLAPLAAASAIAAGLLLWMGSRSNETDEARVKGDSVSLSLVASDDAVLEAGVYRDGQVVKALVTCPPSLAGAHWDLVVFDDVGSSFPLQPARIACGNAVPLPGAFRLMGRTPQEVCVVWDDVPIERSSLVAGARDRRACIKLEPAR